MQERIANLPATVVRPSGPEKAPPVLMLPGVGLGRWLFERAQTHLAAAGVPSVAVDLPGHGDDSERDVGLDEILDAASEAADKLNGCAVLGHSFGGYVAQVVAERVPLHALILVNALPTKGVPYWPSRIAARMAARHLPALLAGRPLRPTFDEYLAAGLALAPEERQRALYDRITPWPNRLARDLLRRPHQVSSEKIDAPILVCSGRRDVIVRWEVSRRLGEWLDAVIWRFDDLGHLGWLQPEGERMERDLAEYVVQPRRRKVTEVDAWRPGEGRGLEERDQARGEQGRQRSAYGQRLGRQGRSATERWDQNITEDGR